MNKDRKWHFVLDRAKDGQFYFTLRAPNNKVVLTSETYVEKRKAIHGIDSVINGFYLLGVLDIVDKTEKVKK